MGNSRKETKKSLLLGVMTGASVPRSSPRRNSCCWFSIQQKACFRLWNAVCNALLICVELNLDVPFGTMLASMPIVLFVIVLDDQDCCSGHAVVGEDKAGRCARLVLT